MVKTSTVPELGPESRLATSAADRMEAILLLSLQRLVRRHTATFCPNLNVQVNFKGSPTSNALL